MNRANYTRQEGQQDPEIMFLSTQGPNELPPIQPDSTMMYEDFHHELEKWAIYRQLP